MEIELGHFYTVAPLARIGLTNAFFEFNLDTIGFTWLAMAFIFVGIAVVRRWFFTSDSLVYTATEAMVKGFAGLCAQTIGYLRLDYLYFIATLFIFTATSCLVSLIPYVEEAPRDANTTFALSLISFIYIAGQSIKQDGLLAYFHHFLGPEEMPTPVRIAMSPLETMGQFSKIISMSFRLFGNVMGGGIVFQVVVSMMIGIKEQFMWAVGIGAIVWLLVFGLLDSAKDEGAGRYINIMIQLLFIVAWIQVFFGIFEALIQAFVISMLSITYLSLMVKHNLKTDEKGIAWS